MNRILSFALTLCLAAGAQAQKLSVLGDSYSTFEGYVKPDHNLVWYATPGSQWHQKENDVDSVSQTWWRLLADNHGLTIERNNSYSGATVSQHGYRNEDYSDRSFFSRVYDLGHPDIILIFGGTNDSWSRAPIGDNVYGGWTNDTLYYFRPAFCYLMHKATTLYPGARIYNITNSELSEDVTKAMDQICRRYGVPNIVLRDIDKQRGHPSQAGMKAIAEQVWESIKQ